MVDLNMHVMDGFDVIEELNKEVNRKKIQILAMSAHYRVDDQKRLESLGVKDCMLKPLTVDKVFALISKSILS